MTMLATTASGDAYTFRDLSDMHTQAGYANIAAHPIPLSPHTVVTART
jgi:hypothetical protein